MNHSSRSEIDSISGMKRQTEGLNASYGPAVLLLLYRYCVVAGSVDAAVSRCCCCCCLLDAAAVFLHLTAEGENREREESQGGESK